MLFNQVYHRSHYNKDERKNMSILHDNKDAREKMSMLLTKFPVSSVKRDQV